jgi:hypothetical protein
MKIYGRNLYWSYKRQTLLIKRCRNAQEALLQEEYKHIARIRHKMKSKMQTSSYYILDFAIIRVVKAILSNQFRQWSNRPVPNRIPIRA